MWPDRVSNPGLFYMCDNVLTRSTAPVRKLVLPPYYPLVVLMLCALSSSSGGKSRLLCSHYTNSQDAEIEKGSIFRV